MALDLRDLSMDKTPRYQQDELDFGVNYMKMFFFAEEWMVHFLMLNQYPYGIPWIHHVFPPLEPETIINLRVYCI